MNAKLRKRILRNRRSLSNPKFYSVFLKFVGSGKFRCRYCHGKERVTLEGKTQNLLWSSPMVSLLLSSGSGIVNGRKMTLEIRKKFLPIIGKGIRQNDDLALLPQNNLFFQSLKKESQKLAIIEYQTQKRKERCEIISNFLVGSYPTCNLG